MFRLLIERCFGTKAQRELRKIKPLLGEIDRLYQTVESHSDEQLRHRTQLWKKELSQITDDAELNRRLVALLPEAYAVVKSACHRLCGRTIQIRGRTVAWDMVPFDVQLCGAIALHAGRIAEMATGEGKTLVATLPAYLNALAGRGVHLVTVNDYLAARDSEWVGEVYRFLGLTVGCLDVDQTLAVRRAQYQCDITYGTVTEFGFDFLRDQGLAGAPEHQVQRAPYFALIDEVDSILIDEARTPMIISGKPTTGANHAFIQVKSEVEDLCRAQAELCATILAEFEKLPKTSDYDHQKGCLLYQAKTGQPKSPSLLQLLEDPNKARILNEAENWLHQDSQRKELFAQREALFYCLDERLHSADLTEKGRLHLGAGDPDAFVLPDLMSELHQAGLREDPAAAKEKIQQDYEAKVQKLHAISQLLKAYGLFEKDKQYVVQNNQVIIVDPHTGRLLPGRRWTEGLHQAIEAKEDVAIAGETQILASVTIQNYFRLYPRLAGMTGTAETEAQELHDIYGLDVLVIPTNRPMQREDQGDSLYKTGQEKFAAVLQEIREMHAKGRPVLVGTVSVETSERLSSLLRKQGLAHEVLNAKNPQREAEIIAQAGKKGSITIATNMAGRGTDIKLGPGLTELGGLHVIGTERHESRRIDRQLRGRCARQGDPGSSHFFLSLEDDLLRLFASDSITAVFQRLGIGAGKELSHPLLTRSIMQAQRRVEQRNFNFRKQTLEYDDVLNAHRKIIYRFRNGLLNTTDLRSRLLELIEEIVAARVQESQRSDGSGYEAPILQEWLARHLPIDISQDQLQRLAEEPESTIVRVIMWAARDAYDASLASADPQKAQDLARMAALMAVDRYWQDHLYAMEALRTSVRLRAYGHQNPLLEYKAEATAAFHDLQDAIRDQVVRNIFAVFQVPDRRETCAA